MLDSLHKQYIADSSPLESATHHISNITKYLTNILRYSSIILINFLSSAAARYLAVGGNVFAISSGYAYDACKSASPIKKVSSKQKHSGEGKNYYHYHPMIKKKVQSHAHCWFI